jgi:hypothetical protein
MHFSCSPSNGSVRPLPLSAGCSLGCLAIIPLQDNACSVSRQPPNVDSTTLLVIFSCICNAFTAQADEVYIGTQQSSVNARMERDR